MTEEGGLKILVAYTAAASLVVNFMTMVNQNDIKVPVLTESTENVIQFKGVCVNDCLEKK